MSEQNDTSIPHSQLVDGFLIPGHFSTENFRSAIQYKPLPNETFIVTYPKCGTTWAQHILLLIFRKGQPLDSPDMMQICSPFLDKRGAKSVEYMPRPGAIKTHLPFHLAPFSSEAKYIYVARNPKDCCVSYFHHTRNILRYFNGSFDEYFELFLSGRVDYGDYFDHLLGWYAHRNDPNVLYVTYEELKEDIDSAVLKMASFLDDEKYAKPIRMDLKVMDNIKKYSSFNFLKESVSKTEEEARKDSTTEIKNGDLSEKELSSPLSSSEKYRGHRRRPGHMRKGIVGDWRNYFSEDQSRRLDEKFAKRTIGAKSAEDMPRPGAIKTHLPFHLTPWSSEAKYIYVARNPKDCCVSYFHHTRNIPGHYYSGSFDHYFELFLSGEVDYGDYFDNLIGWYSHRNDPNVLFVTYEQMKEDIEAAILKIASFIDDEKYAEPIRKNRDMMDNIVKYSSFEHLKETVNKEMVKKFSRTHTHEHKEPLQPQAEADSSADQANDHKVKNSTKHKTDPGKFIRKGIIGDWKNYFTDEQSRRLDEKFMERTKDTDILNLWKKYM